ncbi:MAG: ArsA family ATPase, partial [Chloroflexi bacterium]|nr:ArsA family ATPase [Chloroflexota bacterium]
MRIILFTGKGGSGVSTIAAATAVAAARDGRRTLAFGLQPGLAAALDSRPRRRRHHRRRRLRAPQRPSPAAAPQGG